MSKKFNIIIIVLIFSVILSGCQLPGKKKKAAQPEILMAQECGLGGLKCCEQEPKCSYGESCCPDPNGSAKNYCANKCGCGGKDEFCCPGENKCGSGLNCVDSICTPCGNLTGRCCEQGEKCFKDKKVTDGQVECREGLCLMCGLDGLVACQNEPKCGLNYLLNNNFCLKCGEANQPCCQDKNKQPVCAAAKGLICDKGFCMSP
jgi:hypothetical protein